MDVTMASSPEEKVRLFRAIFRGREDVYARRYVSAKSGKSGYSPVCSVEWTRGVCDKKRVACAVCPNRRLEPLDDEVVRMHVRGVDAATADLFVMAAVEAGKGKPPDGARSAAECFLFKYLDGLPRTKGLFALNGRIDVPFGPNPFREVELLCEARRIAVEIDGAFHFADAEHYRRDRRKDFLLQKNGYLVLRFLAEDVTRRLSQVIDEISVAIENSRHV